MAEDVELALLIERFELNVAEATIFFLQLPLEHEHAAKVGAFETAASELCVNARTRLLALLTAAMRQITRARAHSPFLNE